MSGGVTKANRVKLSQLRGKGAQAALDARKLAETAILTAMKDKEVRSTIHIPSVIPEDVSQLMKDNELENATIIFSHQAMRLFSHMFGNSMQVAVEQAMQGIEKKIEEVIERKSIEMMNYASNAMANMMGVPQHTTEIKELARVYKLPLVARRRHLKVNRKDNEPVSHQPLNNKMLSAIQQAVASGSRMPQGAVQFMVLQQIQTSYPKSIKAAEMTKGILNLYGVDLSSRIHTILSLLEKKEKIAKVRGKYGHYVQKM